MMRILDLLYPPLCPLCGRTLRRSLDTFPLCEACAAELQSIKGNGLCEPQEVLPDNVGLYYAYRYTGLLREAVLRYKYKGALWMAEPFAELFHKRMLESGGYGQFDLAAYVPVSGRSLAVRGYDQTLEIVKRIAKKSGLQYVSCFYKKDAAGDNAAEREKPGGPLRIHGKSCSAPQPIDTFDRRYPDNGGDASGMHAHFAPPGRRMRVRRRICNRKKGFIK